jgi:ABC-type Mn2+/Zn2+ transport system permease subunit
LFALGFMLGAVRTFFVRDAPSGGRLLGVLIELPIMLSASWFLCRYVVRRFAVAPTVVAHAVMGGLAFALLLLAELVVGALLLGRTPGEHFALYRDASYALGLAAQMAFALMPLVKMRQGERP